MEKEWNQPLYNNMVRELGQHIVCLTLTVRQFADGQPLEDERIVNFSGFVISLGGSWFLVTAGHALQELENHVRSGTIQILRSAICDTFGPATTSPLPTPIDYSNDAKYFIDRGELGLDFAVLFIRPLYRSGLKLNGIRPLDEGAWITLKNPLFTDFVLYGFPLEFTKPLPDETLPFGRAKVTNLQPLVIYVKRIHEPQRLLPEAPFDWFIGKAYHKIFGVSSIMGMSGGPIFGFTTLPDGKLRYGVIAIQSRWDGNDCIYACSIEVLAGWLGAMLGSLDH